MPFCRSPAGRLVPVAGRSSARPVVTLKTAQATLPEIPDCPNSQMDDAQQKWQEAYDMWLADHQEWQTAFQEYKDEL